MRDAEAPGWTAAAAVVFPDVPDGRIIVPEGEQKWLGFSDVIVTSLYLIIIVSNGGRGVRRSKKTLHFQAVMCADDNDLLGLPSTRIIPLFSSIEND